MASQVKSLCNGFASIICRISIDANEEEFSIGRKVHLNNWNVEHKKAKGDSEGKKTNQKISQVAVDLERYFSLLQSEYENITPLMLKNIYKGLPPEHKIIQD